MERCPACHHDIEDCDCFNMIEPIDEEVKEKPKVKKHGTGGYAYGCRCEICKDSKKKSSVEYRRANKESM